MGLRGLRAAILLISACLASGAPASNLGFQLLYLGGHPVKWGKPVFGTGAEITYAFIGRHRDFHGINCNAMDPLAPALRGSGIDETALRRAASAAFAWWSDVANIRFVETPAGEAADILIGAQSEPSGWAFTNVQEEQATPSSGNNERALGRGAAALVPSPRTSDQLRAIQQSLICLNPAKQWKIGFDGNLDVYDLQLTLAHEIGHAIGLDHPGPTGELMGYRYTELQNGLAAGDIAGAMLLYGKAPPSP